MAGSFRQTNRPNASNPRAIADASACLEVAVGPFTLWQLLNQRQPFPGDNSSDPDPQQSSGQAIGQSLVDFWNRAQDDGLDHLIDHPGPSDEAIVPMPLPFYPSDSSRYRENPLLNSSTGRGVCRLDQRTVNPMSSHGVDSLPIPTSNPFNGKGPLRKGLQKLPSMCR
jgi:hypothetical protein